MKPTGLTWGAASDLDAIVTVEVPLGLQAVVVIGTNSSFYRLRAGTDAESSPGIIRPDDYAATTNEKVLEKLSVV